MKSMVRRTYKRKTRKSCTYRRKMRKSCTCTCNRKTCKRHSQRGG